MKTEIQPNPPETEVNNNDKESQLWQALEKSNCQNIEDVVDLMLEKNQIEPNYNFLNFTEAADFLIQKLPDQYKENKYILGKAIRERFNAKLTSIDTQLI